MPEHVTFKSDTSMAGKVCLITGGSAGIGRATALELARRGAEVVIVGRDHDRCAAVVREIRQATHSDTVSCLCADLSSQDQVRQLAREFRLRHDRLHVLINNAGGMFALRQESIDGIEMNLALNHLAYFLLTDLLLEVIKRSAPARVINVSSDAHEMVRGFDFDDPQARHGAYGVSEFRSLLYALFLPRHHPGLMQYARSKLANVLFTYELSRRLTGSGVSANVLHPGFVRSKFAAGNGSYGWFMRRLASIIAISPDAGAKTPVYLATSPELENVTGRYFVEEKPAASSHASHDVDAARRLWQLSEQLTATESGE
jgi:NAD(P)-dependent dehydrogenase (short-subunit alcohol dehydrogenase family)